MAKKKPSLYQQYNNILTYLNSGNSITVLILDGILTYKKAEIKGIDIIDPKSTREYLLDLKELVDCAKSKKGKVLLEKYKINGKGQTFIVNGGFKKTLLLSRQNIGEFIGAMFKGWMGISIGWLIYTWLYIK